uniref:TCTP domain-containing protein n=2 Tax=Phaeomonas parva TaxID=124430 RepID=A0A7S1TWA5_9STRA|mmetsp:Transcript_20706/g.62993  ORF Transcript_20706/g.62993 Transcript_20706/m.62993 type:complete len:108 (+) Transcript_20706:474-797(+)
MVNNVESAANLQELTPPPSKKEFKEWFVEFAKRVRKNLKEDPEKGPTEAKAWIARTKGILGWINENYADIQFYTNSDFDMDGCMCFAIYQSDKDFYFMSDALKAVKF